MRLDKFLAESSVGNRKVVREYIKNGLVKVNGDILLEPAREINEKCDVVEYLHKQVIHKGKVYYMFHKPAGYITAKKDSINKTVFDLFHKDEMNGVFHVGRLDKDTEGLLLLTNDGEFEHHLMCPNKHVEKTYFFWALGSLDKEEEIKLEQGVYINKGEILTKPAKIKIEKQGVYGNLKEEMPVNILKNINSNYYNQPVVCGYITISEGRKHQVKRMLKAVGCYIVYLKREAIGDLKLDNSLSKGEYRQLTKLEVQKLMKKSNLKVGI